MSHAGSQRSARTAPVRDLDRNRRDLTITLVVTAAYCTVEGAGGMLTNSLALLSDAGHMFADVAALGLSLGKVLDRFCGHARSPLGQEAKEPRFRVEVGPNGRAFLISDTCGDPQELC